MSIFFLISTFSDVDFGANYVKEKCLKMQNIEFGFRKFKHNLKDIDNIILSYKKMYNPFKKFQNLNFINYPKVNTLPQF